MSPQTGTPLSVIHVLRTPVGGLFRHVCDLAKAQSELGIHVGVFCDSTSGGENADHILKDLQHFCKLGIHRAPIGRLPGIGDLAALKHLRKYLNKLRPEILHGHGAKGGAYARLLGHSIGAKSFYTPHGGSLHYSATSLTGFIFLKLEHLLSRRTDGIIFESEFSQKTYLSKIGDPSCARRVIHNGIGDEDFRQLTPHKNTSDFVFIGELRQLKGVDILLHALAKLKETPQHCTCTIVGDGPDGDAFRQLALELGLGDTVYFAGFKPASEGFSYGRQLVIPSRAESFPYIILEGAAANLPVITTNVGGIAEIFGDQADLLLPSDNITALADALKFAMNNPDEMNLRSQTLHRRVKDLFNVQIMTKATVDFYSSV